MPLGNDELFDAGFSDTDNDQGYDSEAAEQSRLGIKRRKLSPIRTTPAVPIAASDDEEDSDSGKPKSPALKGKTQITSSSAQKTKMSIGEVAKPSPKSSKPGVIYLSSLPPYLKPSALRNLLVQRGFSPIARLFLAPASKAKTNVRSKKNSRQLYAEGWIEFKSKRTAKRCAEALNATTIGGRKGGFYHDDIWNMKYLRGVGWDDLMAQVREERREEEVKTMEERRQIAKETKDFIEGVEKGKMARGIQRSQQKKRKKGDQSTEGTGASDLGDVDISGQRTWRQYRVKEGPGTQGESGVSLVSDDVKKVLSKIF